MMDKPRRIISRATLRLALVAVTCVLGSTAPPILAQGAGLPAIQLRGVENLGIGTSPPKAAMAKVSADLLALYAEYQAYLQQTSGRGAAAPAFKSTNTIAPVAGGSVVIDTAASGDPQALAADLRALGADKVTVFGRMVSARVPITAIPALKNLSSLQFARPAYTVIRGGDVTSQGDASMRADIGRTAFGVDGTGILVGTLSDSYDCLGGAAAGVASGDLPAGVTVLEEGLCPATDEGRGMMEIIHDVAPGAMQAFHTAEGGQANFAQGIIDLANAGAQVINDDIGYPDEPFYQDGIIAQAIDTVKGMGVAYFSAAGNDARQAYESPFRPSGQVIDLGAGPEELHDFDPGTGVDTCQQITIPVGHTLVQIFQWDQPFFSVSGPPGSASDMDIILTNAACTAIVSGSVELNVGGDAFEFFRFGNAGPATTFGVIILQFSGSAPGLMKTVNFGSGSITIDQFDTKTGASWGHPVALGGLGVGAAFYQNTPTFGQNPPLIETFSSAGGSPILFDTGGNRLATPEVRQQPGITAPDGADTTFFCCSDPDSTGFPNFPGTSAAAPHAAAVATLMKGLDPSLTPDTTYAALKTTAIDMDDPSTGGFDAGFDFGTGFGLIQADAALGEVAPPPPPPPPPPPVVAQCRGVNATIVGTEGDDTLVGTPIDDVIVALGGHDSVDGQGGNDLICLGPGNDRASGGAGRDRIFGETGRDRIKGGNGRDRCIGGPGRDTAISCERVIGVP